MDKKNLGPYEIIGAIGAGGMGEVYKARDTRLNRMVAIKVLPKDVAADPERRQRFEREAQAIAALNHPNICVVYDVGEDGGIFYMVMEYLDGETLSGRLEKGPLPLDQALKCAIEIGDALDKAHERGVVHRDLKPANIMLVKSGAKLLDFGLAKFEATSTSTVVSQLPTNLTMQGTVLGTPQYMSPEQVEGMEPDARTDIFAFGVVFYEMLTGAKAFQGKSQASLMASILEHQPQPMTTHQQSIPPALERIVQTCLRKASEDRWQNMRDLVLQLRWIAEGRTESNEAAASTSIAAAPQKKGRELIAWGLLAVTVLALIFMVWRNSQVAPVEKPAVEFAMAPPDDNAFSPSQSPLAPFPAVSPDGHYIAFLASKTGAAPNLWVRSLDSMTARELAGTGGAVLPFWSGDSKEIGFFVGNEIKKIDRAGGPVFTIAKNANTAGATWSRNGTILYLPVKANGLYKVSASGGEPVQVTKVAEKTGHIFPHFLPDGSHFLYREAPSGKIFMASLDSPQQAKEILKADSEAYPASGHLLFLRQGTLLAQVFDEKTGTVSGEAFRIADNVRSNASGFATLSVSDAGVLAYRVGGPTELRAAFFDRNGKQLDPINQTGDNRYPRLSPDDTKIAVQRGTANESDGSDIWIIDAMRGTNTRLTFTPESETFPIWTPDGTRVAYATNKNGKTDIYWKLASGLGEAEEILKSDQDKYPLDFSPDGKLLLFRMDAQKTGQDMFVVSLADKQIKPFLQTPFAENGGRFSPDGKWIAYFSTESGTQQIFVQPYPPTGAKWQVSVDGGTSVTWARDKKELYFVSADNKMMSVDYTAGTEFKAGIPRMLFQIQGSPSNATGLRFSVSRNGDRFLLPVNGSAAEHPLTVVFNWVSALKK